MYLEGFNECQSEQKGGASVEFFQVSVRLLCCSCTCLVIVKSTRWSKGADITMGSYVVPLEKTHSWVPIALNIYIQSENEIDRELGKLSREECKYFKINFLMYTCQMRKAEFHKFPISIIQL